MKIGLFYGSTTCYTEMAAEKIRGIIGEDLVDIHNVKETPLSFMADYDLLLLGISTWDFGEIQEDWNELWEDIATTPMKGKVVALFGLGDQEGPLGHLDQTEQPPYLSLALLRCLPTTHSSLLEFHRNPTLRYQAVKGRSPP